MNLTSKIFVAGHRGLVGSALLRRLEARGHTNLVTRSHGELDLEDPQAVAAFFSRELPEVVFLAAAKVGGIHANNTYPVDFLLRNLKIQNNVIESSWRSGVKGLLFLGSSCIYPRLAPQPLKEECLLTGLLEPTNEPYAVAKIAGIELCAAFNRQYGTRFLSVMPTNLYGPNDSYDLQNSHVLPALIRKCHLAKLAAQGDWESIKAEELRYGAIPPDFFQCIEGIARANGHGCLCCAADPPGEAGAGQPPWSPALTLWGTGRPRREFLYSDDAADACIFLMENLGKVFGEDSTGRPAAQPSPSGGGTDHAAPTGPAPGSSLAARHLVNIGCGEDLTIAQLAEQVASVVGHRGPVEWDASKPDGTPRKLLDVSRLTALGWAPRISLEEGVRLAYKDYLAGLSRP